MSLWALLPISLSVNIALAAEPAIRVYLFDQSNLPAEDMKTFVTSASGILQRAGIGSVWLNCSAGDACPDQFDASDFIVRVMPIKKKDHFRALGSSFAGTEGGSYATIYFPTVKDKALDTQVPIPVLLALATVHELGHLILGSQSHWPDGIMNARWGAKELREMTSRNRFFNPSQSRQLQARLAARQLH